MAMDESTGLLFPHHTHHFIGIHIHDRTNTADAIEFLDRAFQFTAHNMLQTNIDGQL